jgi:hypothetical protein
LREFAASSFAKLKTSRLAFSASNTNKMLRSRRSPLGLGGGQQSDDRIPMMGHLNASSKTTTTKNKMTAAMKWRRRRPRLAAAALLLLLVQVAIACACWRSLIASAADADAKQSKQAVGSGASGHLARQRRSPAGASESPFETFMDEQVAAVSPLHLGMDVRLTAAGVGGPFSPNHLAADGQLQRLLDAFAQRLLMAAEGPDGGMMRVSLIDSLQLDRILADDYDDGGGERAAWRARANRDEQLRRQEFGKAVTGLKASVRAAQLNSMLDVYDIDSFDSNKSPATSKRHRQGERDSVALSRLSRADLERRVNETLNELPTDEQWRLRRAAVDAYGLEPGGPAEGCTGPPVHGGRAVRKKRDLAGAGRAICSAIAIAPRVLARLADRAIEIGLAMFDRLVATSEFLEAIPVLSDRVRALRARAEPVFVIVEEIRRVHYLFKVSRCPENLGLEGLAANGTCDNGQRGQHDTADKPPADEQNGRGQVGQLVSQDGAEALYKLTKLLVRDLGTDDKAADRGVPDEIISRLTYSLMTWLLSGSGSAPAQAAPGAR